MSKPEEQLRLSPVKGRVGHSRQVPDKIVAIEDLLGRFLNDVVTEAFHKYTKHGSYSSPVGHTFPQTVHLYCNTSDLKIATINITKEINQNDR